MFHFRHRYMRRVRITQNHHAERITDENERNARLVEQFRHGKIISRERRNIFAAIFHRANRFDGVFFRIHQRLKLCFGEFVQTVRGSLFRPGKMSGLLKAGANRIIR